jgi:hypothetical protein
MSMKNSNEKIGNRNRDLMACSAVPQPSELPRAPTVAGGEGKNPVPSEYKVGMSIELVWVVVKEKYLS